ncbi:hypothetical protein AAGV28_09120 [Flavobacterium sp. FZUC8N2.13]|uniref:Uncharacterized protein n=1 Tax=Flavobacterium zubiriense TaxID=3138075 RepID=A0ABV4TBS9_9FLAO
MDITYYFIGLLTGVSVTTFFTGKELYKYYTKYRIQQKQLDRILKLNDEIKKLKNLKPIKTANYNTSM